MDEVSNLQSTLYPRQSTVTVDAFGKVRVTITGTGCLTGCGLSGCVCFSNLVLGVVFRSTTASLPCNA